MDEVHQQRITLKRTRPNPLFQQWLEEVHEEAIAKKNKLEPMINEALQSLSKYPLPLASGSECAILKGFDKSICIFLDSRLAEYNKNNSRNRGANDVNSQQAPTNATNNSVEMQLSRNTEISNNGSVKSTNFNSGGYSPAYRSGAYAILLALLEYCKSGNNLPIDKDKLIEIGQKYCEESFTTPKPESWYTAWSSMTQLLKKKLVIKSNGRKPSYLLTEHGIILAEKLLEEYKSLPTANEIIFNGHSSPHLPIGSESTEPIVIRDPSNDQIFSNYNESPTEILAESYKITSMDPETFEIILLIDKNETSGLSKKNEPTVAQFNKYPDLKHEYRSLKLGDFLWIARRKCNEEDEIVLPYIVERKRMDDLGASIKDGRFHEQKFRLKKCGVKNVIYMVEHYGSNKYVGLPIQTLMQALANTRVQDDFKIHLTNSLTQSIQFLAILTKRLTSKYQACHLKGHNSLPTSDTLMTFDYFNKSSSKNKPLSVRDTFIKLLLQIKGISVEKALAITNIYRTPRSIIKAYERCEKKDGELLLANLKFNNTTNVGPSTSKSIYQLFNAN